LGKLAEPPSEKVLMLPMEFTGVLGSLAGIGEIAKRTFSNKWSAGPTISPEQLSLFAKQLLPSPQTAE
jgi:hypothetical protein